MPKRDSWIISKTDIKYKEQKQFEQSVCKVCGGENDGIEYSFLCAYCEDFIMKNEEYEEIEDKYI